MWKNLKTSENYLLEEIIKTTREMGKPVPDAPIFLKPDSALLPKEIHFIPDFSKEVHYEVELILK